MLSIKEMIELEEKVKQMKFVLNDVADNFTIKDNNTIVLDNTEFKLNLENDIITLQNENRFIKISNDDSIIIVNDFIKYKKINGCIIEKLTKVYGYSIYSSEKRTLTDIFSTRYVFNKDMDIMDEEAFENACKMKTTFESHMRKLIIDPSSPRYCTTTPYSTYTLVNGENISRIYDIVNGIDKIYRVYDLYNGIENERNKSDINAINLGLLDSNAFDYKTKHGITKKENQVCYLNDRLFEDIKPIKITDKNKEELMQSTKSIPVRQRKGMFYTDEEKENYIEESLKKKMPGDIVKQQIEKELGISYSDFEKLDLDEQHKLIELKSGKELKPDYRLYIDGMPMDDNHIITRKQIDKKIDKIVYGGPLKRLIKKLRNKRK